MRRMKTRRLILPVWLALCVATPVAVGISGCNQDSGYFRISVIYFPTAEENYWAGVKELKAKHYISAEQLFRHIRTNFGFSKWATLAELGLADLDRERGKYIEAVDAYRQFMKSHPSNERVVDGYCAFKIASCSVDQIPTDWFITPPSYEKDQGPVNDAIRELATFGEEYPLSPYVPKARDMMSDCLQHLADHDLYVAGFYLDRHKPKAAILRLEHVVKHYPGARREAETLLLLGKVYLEMQQPGDARATFQKLADEHPDDFRARKAALYIQFIDQKYPGAVATPHKG
jgi:outer membrane protein assembly factor BamD